MGVVIDEVQVDAMEREARPEPHGTEAPKRGRPKLDPSEFAAVQRRHAERMQRLWAD